MLFAHLTGIKWEYIPGKGGAQAVLDVAGQADAHAQWPARDPAVRESGKLKLLAVSGENATGAACNSHDYRIRRARFRHRFVAGNTSAGKTLLSLPGACRNTASCYAKIKEDYRTGRDRSTTPETEFMRRERERCKLIRDTGYKTQ
jgi:hypothetical protein